MRFDILEPPKARLKSLKSFLRQVHIDLFKVDRYATVYVYPLTLSKLEEMVLILEDRRFFIHNGVDYRASMRELLKAVSFRKHGGASTIDMQLVRTVTGYKKKEISRKLYEMLLARVLQFRYSKIQILRAYMNCAFFGSHLIGARAACQKIYDKRPEDLDLQEASVIASLLVYPRPQIPTEAWRRKIERRAKYAVDVYPRFEEKLQKFNRS